LNEQAHDKNSLFTLALGVQAPWSVSETKFSEENGRLDIYLACAKGFKFSCPDCNEMLGVHDSRERSWKHLNFFQYEAFIHANLPRIKCSKCKIHKNVDVPWARPNSGFTLLFEAFAMELAQAMPMTDVKKIVKEQDTRLMRIIKYYVKKAREKVDMSDVKKIATDETSKTKGHNYITTFIDIDEKKILFATEGKDNTTVKRFVEDLEKHNGKAENITQACCDLSKAFIKGVKENLVNAETIFDRYHVMDKIINAQEEVRKQEQAQNPLLKGSRYALLHNPETATEKQVEKLAQLSKLNLKTVRAYNIRLALRDVYEIIDPAQAEIGSHAKSVDFSKQ
ncbi:MAG: ISL3 family transposase, partial [Bacteroidetes bacterium]|nr:ISL3 family transposase [Bacteroidota bacterium]